MTKCSVFDFMTPAQHCWRSTRIVDAVISVALIAVVYCLFILQVQMLLRIYSYFILL